MARKRRRARPAICKSGWNPWACAWNWGPVLSLAASANREKGLEMARLEKRLREQIRAELMKEMGPAPKRRRQRVFFLAGLALLASVVSVSASLAGPPWPLE